MGDRAARANLDATRCAISRQPGKEMMMNAKQLATAGHRADDGPINPDLLPRVYAATGKGDCLEPIYHDGCCLVFDRLAECQLGDVVVLWLRPEIVKPGNPQQIVKRLVWRYGGTVVVEMLNPFRTFTLQSEDILAMHKCIGEGESDGRGGARVRRSLLTAEAAATCYA